LGKAGIPGAEIVAAFIVVAGMHAKDLTNFGDSKRILPF
jgi:hypothetical protein